MQILRKSGRGWRVLIPRHSTVAAYAALILAGGGTAVAATGGTFLLGHTNKAAATSGLTNTGKGAALSLKTSSAKYAPLSVSSKTMVTNLNANYLGGLPASAFASTESASIAVTGTDCALVTCVNSFFGAISGVTTGQPSQGSVDVVTPDVPLTPGALSVQLSGAPGSTTVVVFLSVNDSSDGTVECAITGSSTTCAFPGSSGTIPAGSRISIAVVTITPSEQSFPAEGVMVGFTLAPA